MAYIIYKSYGEWISSKVPYKISSLIRVGSMTSTNELISTDTEWIMLKIIQCTWQAVPRRVATGQLTHTCAEGQPEEQPAGQPKGHRVVVPVRGTPAQQTQRSNEHSQKPSLQQQHIPMRRLQRIRNSLTQLQTLPDFYYFWRKEPTHKSL